jgi:hypothetical protein
MYLPVWVAKLSLCFANYTAAFTADRTQGMVLAK